MTIQTVNGPIEPDALGKTLIHEHVLLPSTRRSPQQWPTFYDRDAELAAAVEQVEGAQRHGARRSSSRPRCSAGATSTSCAR